VRCAFTCELALFVGSHVWRESPKYEIEGENGRGNLGVGVRNVLTQGERERERKRVHGHAVVGPLGQVNGEKRQGRHARNVLQANCNLAYIFFCVDQRQNGNGTTTFLFARSSG